MASKNVYHRRLVAESSAKSCLICYKPSSTVLITPDQDDWFHVCPGHLNDVKFAIPKDAEEVAQRKRDEEIQKEIEAIKKEYQDKVQKKTDRKSQGDTGKDTKGDVKQKRDDDVEQAEKERDEKISELEKTKGSGQTKTDGPRIFELQKHFYQMRMTKKKESEMARKNRERLRNPATFPNVPSGNP